MLHSYQSSHNFWSGYSRCHSDLCTPVPKVLRKFCKKFEYDQQKDSLFYIDKQKDGSTLKRLVIKEEEKSRVFEECHSADFSGHAGRNNTLKKVKQRYYWPDYYKDTVEMVRIAFHFHARFFHSDFTASIYIFLNLKSASETNF